MSMICSPILNNTQQYECACSHPPAVIHHIIVIFCLQLQLQGTLPSSLSAHSMVDVDAIDNREINNNMNKTVNNPPVPPTWIHLFGERNSGTVYMESVLASAFYPQCSIVANQCHRWRKKSGCSPNAHGHVKLVVF